MLDIRLSLLGLLLVAVPSQAQQPTSSGAQAVPSYVLVRKLSDTDVVKKREGGFFTGHLIRPCGWTGFWTSWKLLQ